LLPPRHEGELDNKAIEQAKRLKEEGNRQFQSKNYQKAIDFYTEALRLSNVPDKEKAILLSNRSATFLLLGDEANFRLALEDAKKVGTFQQCEIIN
jgi:hypothetical protein